MVGNRGANEQGVVRQRSVHFQAPTLMERTAIGV
jgi:hypothetical protein